MTAKAAAAFPLDGYVVDVLMRDLVGHDRSPAAFVVYLLLWRRTRGGGGGAATSTASAASAAAAAAAARLSHRDIAEETGLSKSAVQQALRILHRRGLVRSKQRHATDTPEHAVQRPWASSSTPSRS